MRGLVIAVVLALAACGGDDGASVCRYQDHDYAVGETWPAGDDCNDCTCTATGVECTRRPCSAPPDANPMTLCQPTGTCTSGPPCGSICCDSGERCEAGACMCGSGPACGDGDSCAAPGPIGSDGCGSICCGASGPCPL